MITNLGNKNNSSKKKKEEETTHGFIFITSLSFGVLAGWAVVVAAEDAGPLPLSSSLAGMGKVAETNLWLWETTPPLEESLGAVEGFRILGETSLGFSFSFTVVLVCSTPLEDYWEEEGPWSEPL